METVLIVKLANRDNFILGPEDKHHSATQKYINAFVKIKNYVASRKEVHRIEYVLRSQYSLR